VNSGNQITTMVSLRRRLRRFDAPPGPPVQFVVGVDKTSKAPTLGFRALHPATARSSGFAMIRRNSGNHEVTIFASWIRTTGAGSFRSCEALSPSHSSSTARARGAHQPGLARLGGRYMRETRWPSRCVRVGTGTMGYGEVSQREENLLLREAVTD